MGAFKMKKILFYSYIFSLVLLFSFPMVVLLQNEEVGSVSENVEQSAKVQLDQLPTVDSYEHFRELMGIAQANRNSYYKRGHALALNEGVEATIAMEEKVVMDVSKSIEADFSGTNVQVQGVDEADVIKTDGKYIYQVNQDRIVIINALPAQSMEVVDTLSFKDDKFTPQEMYIDDQYLVIIGHSYKESVKAMIYDIANKKSIKKIRELELEGHYVSSRKIGSSIYLIANKYIYPEILKNEGQQHTLAYRDTAISEETNSVDYKEIHYFPHSIESNYLLVGGLNLKQMDQEMQVSTYLGAGESNYASEENLYVVVTNYVLPESKAKIWSDEPPTRNTSVYKFQLHSGKVQYVTSGEVPGNILNQFSMDEHKGSFRIATTSGDMGRADEHTSKNHLYILDQQMNITGKINDIARGERIYSVRFMGDRGYMVTFKTVDPLFVFDLKDPSSPKILGELKIPGYSDYLHPYDENHIIGFGKSTIESQDKSMAFYQGMKVALFDITDVNHPKEKFVEIIGDRGTESELLHNHKALLFSKKRNLLAFPVTLMKVNRDGKQSADDLAYGQFATQGAFVYHLDLEQGFKLRKIISHFPEDNDSSLHSNSNSGTSNEKEWYNTDRHVERALYIGDTIYTISKGMIKAHDLPSLKEVGSTTIPINGTR
jgi:inhibitor of cysteine peptidase